MERIRTLLVDDEPLALDLLRIECAKVPHAQVVGEARDGREAVAAIAEIKPDMVLIDVQMPELDGLAVLQAQLQPGPLFVFVTAHSGYAVEAFDLEATDYLVKPVRTDRLARAFDRVRRKLLTRAAAGAAPPRTGATDGVWVTGREGYVRIGLEDIDWIESDRDYVLIHSRGRSHMLRATLTSIAERLDPREFVRVRRSALVRIASVRNICRASRASLELVMADGARLRVGPSHAAQVRSAFGLERLGFR